MLRSYLILTDSGGIQEEATVLGKPTLVMRETTERREAVEAGTALLVGTDESRILSTAENLLHDRDAYERMAQANSPFGNGYSSQEIVRILQRHLALLC
jgi:UDP-N-acetylglucosamine 2-epimerase (non-hydrolysing)